MFPSELPSYTDSGDGIAARLQQAPSVLDARADPSGELDSYGAFLTIYTLAPAGTWVIVPPGRYYLSKALPELNKNIVWLCHGATQPDGASTLLLPDYLWQFDASGEGVNLYYNGTLILFDADAIAKSSINQPNGVAGLDGSAHVPIANLPVNIANGVAGTDANNTISPQLAAPAIVSTTSIPRAISSMRGDIAHLLDFMPAPDGTSERFADINSILLALYNRGGGTLVVPWVNANAYTGNTPITPYPNVKLIGDGNSTPMLQLLSGASCAIVSTPYFSTLISGSTTGVPSDLVNGCHDAQIVGLWFDGNSTNQSNTSFDLQSGICLFGNNTLLRDVYITNAFGHGLYTGGPIPQTTFGNSVNTFQPSFQHIRINNCGGHGWWDVSMHDKHAYDILVQSASASATLTYDGFHMQASGRYDMLHSWSDIVPHIRYGFYCDGQQHIVSNSQFETCQQSIYAGCYSSVFTAVQCYNNGIGAGSPPPAGSAMMTIGCTSAQAPTNVIVSGCFFNAATVGGPGFNDTYAIQMGDTAGGFPFASGIVVKGCIARNFQTRALVNFSTANGGNNYIDIVGVSGIGTATPAVTGYADNDVVYISNNGSAGGTLSVARTEFDGLSNYNQVAATTGGIHSSTNTEVFTLLTASATLASYTVRLPSSPFMDGQRYRLRSNQTITALTLLWNGSSANIFGAPATIGPTAPVSFRYYAALGGTGVGGWLLDQ